MSIERGDLLLVDLEPTRGSEQGRVRPCLVVQNDVRNKNSPTTIIVPLTSRLQDKEYPTIVTIEPADSGLDQKSVVLCYQIRTISVRDRVIKKLGKLSPIIMSKVNDALKASLDLD